MDKTRGKRRTVWLLPMAAITVTAALYYTGCASERRAGWFLKDSGVKGGIVVHLGCGDGRLTAALHAHEGYLVQGLDSDAKNVERARAWLHSKNLYGRISVDVWDGGRLPYIDNLVNLIICEHPQEVSKQEILRVLCPRGVAYVRQKGKWDKIVKPRPNSIDDWTHYLYDAGGNPVSHDSAVGPPRRLQWVGSPMWARHHDHTASMSALVSSNGRIFYIMDEAPAASILLPPEISLIARDAFNGTVLWKRPIKKWHTHLWPLKSGPAQLPRRLVAHDDRVYTTLGIDAPLSMLDAATGRTIHTYENTKATEEVLYSDGVLYLLVNDSPVDSAYENLAKVRAWYRKSYWDESPRSILAIAAESGDLLWQKQNPVVPLSLASADDRLFYHNGERLICRHRTSGELLWQSEPVARCSEILSFFAPTLVVYKDVLLFAGGETAGKQMGSWYTGGEDNLTAVSTETGEILWSAYHPPSGYRSPEDVIVIDDVVWSGETLSGEVPGEFIGRDLYTGEVKSRFVPDVDTYWFHHRCYRSKATDRYIMTSRTGIEYIDPDTRHWDINHWVRGGCLYGIMPGNGAVYAPPHPCACYPEAKLSGFCSLISTSSLDDLPGELTEDSRLSKGPAYGKDIPDPDRESTGEWPTFRQNPSRSGHTQNKVPHDLERLWSTKIGGKLSSLVIAGGMVWVASVDAHTLNALEAGSGEVLWSFTAGARIDSPPTFYRGRVLFGSTDGRVYCLRASDGELIWRFQAAPYDRRLTSYEQLESVWPVHGSVLVRDGVVYFVAGRSMFLDKGMRFYRLDAQTGEMLSSTTLDEHDPDSGDNLQNRVRYLTLPVALPDILSCDGRNIYMRSQRFDFSGERIDIDPMAKEPFNTLFREKGQDMQHTFQKYYMLFLSDANQNQEGKHLFSPTGFLDDSWWHRSYWIYGNRFTGGWNGYYLAGKFVPAGKILVHDEGHVYGFGRKPKYYRWTTALEYQLFKTAKNHNIGARQILEGNRRGRYEPDRPIEHDWTADAPLLARAMVLAGGTLFAAGPPDLVDEEQAIKDLDSAGLHERLVQQRRALSGREGAVLLALSSQDGARQAEIVLDSPPVWDGMAAAYQKLYIANEDGRVICMGGGD